MQEQGSDAAGQAVLAAESLLSSRLAHVETRSALARMRAGKRVSASEYRQALRDFSSFWTDLGVSEVEIALTDAAGDLAERYGLRAYDALHLATALDVTPTVHPAFLCFDLDLRKAAGREGLPILPPDDH